MLILLPGRTANDVSEDLSRVGHGRDMSLHFAWIFPLPSGCALWLQDFSLSPSLGLAIAFPDNNYLVHAHTHSFAALNIRPARHSAFISVISSAAKLLRPYHALFASLLRFSNCDRRESTFNRLHLSAV
jgi:hypothetical protein